MQRADLVATGAVAVGGATGAVARYAVGLTTSWHPPQFPWATLAVNLVGCAAIGLVLVLLTEAVSGPAWLRPFLATGVLGGFTTFSAFAVDTVRLVDDGAAATAATYVAASVIGGLLLVRTTAVATRWTVVGRGRR